MSIGKRIEESRDRLGWTQAELATRAGVSSQNVGNWERGVYLPKLPVLIQLARLLNVDLTWLITGTYPITVTAVTDRGEAAYRGRVVPSISWSSIDKFIQSQYVPDMSARSQFPCGPRSFHSVLGDRSMEPEIGQGDGLVVDPDLAPEPGDLVMVKLGDDVLVRIYKPQEHDVLLLPANKLWPERTIPKLTSEVLIGVVSETTRQRRKV